MHVCNKRLKISQGREPIQPRKILIVDDEFLIRWSLTGALSQAGYEVTAVEDGRKAIDIASAQHFDFVITDLAMPEVDGWMLLDMLMQFQFPPRVIVMTANEEEDHPRIVKEKGGWAYVKKSHLVDQVKEALEAGPL